MLDRTYNVVELLERKVCLVDFAAWLKATTRITDAYFITFFWWVITKKASSSFPGSAASLSSSCPASPWSSSTSSSSPPWGEQSRGGGGWQSTEPTTTWRKIKLPSRREEPWEGKLGRNYFIIVTLRINKYSINLSFNQGGEKKQSINKYSFSFRRLSMFGFSKEQRDRRQRDANSTTMMLIVVIAVFLAVELPLSTMTALHTISSR